MTMKTLIEDCKLVLATFVLSLGIPVNKLLTRIRTAYKIIFRKYDHWVVLNVNDENLIKLLKEENFECDVEYHGLQPYVFRTMIKMVANEKDDNDMLLDKIIFEAEAENRKKTRI